MFSFPYHWGQTFVLHQVMQIKVPEAKQWTMSHDPTAVFLRVLDTYRSSCCVRGSTSRALSFHASLPWTEDGKAAGLRSLDCIARAASCAGVKGVLHWVACVPCTCSPCTSPRLNSSASPACTVHPRSQHASFSRRHSKKLCSRYASWGDVKRAG
jgi:hypothetical protein